MHKDIETKINELAKQATQIRKNRMKIERLGNLIERIKSEYLKEEEK
jgi:two-component SAPR family response regulator